jgi:ribosome-binding protein aMBF1 (putative translation factor)
LIVRNCWKKAACTTKTSRSKGFIAIFGVSSQNPHESEDFMKIPVETVEALGQVVRASRKAQKIRQDDAAGSIGVSENFLGKIERGGETVQWGKLFQVLQGLGIKVELDVPEEVGRYLAEQDRKRGRASRSP